MPRPYMNGEPITPSDSAEIAPGVRAITLGTAGTVQVVFHGSSNTDGVQLTLQAGLHEIGNIKKVRATGTSATGIAVLR